MQQAELFTPPAPTNATLENIKSTLWAAADKLRGHMDASDYKHVVLGLIFLKYISDSFERLQAEIKADGGNPDDPDEYLALNGFYIPPVARWSYLQGLARDPAIGQHLDKAMDAIGQQNPRLRQALPRDYGRPALDKTRLGQLVDLFTNLNLDNAAYKGDLLGDIYEYFLGQFAAAEGRSGGEFYTPRSIVELLVEMLQPLRGRVYDPCCGSGGMFVQSEKFAEAHGGRRLDISIFGQESNPTTWRLCEMNLAIRGIEGDLGSENADSFTRDLHLDLRADFVLANPPFNISDWGNASNRSASDPRWKYGLPPAANANYAWLQHILYHLAEGGAAGVVLANGSMSSTNGGEDEIRRRLIEADLVECLVALPSQLFSGTQIPACLWFLRRGGKARPGQTLFIDARDLGQMVSRVRRELTPNDLHQVADTFHAWQGQDGAVAPYADIPGFCKSASLEEIKAAGFILTPGRYVGAKPAPQDSEPFEQKMARLVATLNDQFAESDRLENLIKQNLQGLGYDG